MSDEFVKMTKDGETIEVNPSVVDDHKRLGWKVVGEPVEAAEPAESEAADVAKPKKDKGNVRKRLGTKNVKAEKEKSSPVDSSEEESTGE